MVSLPLSIGIKIPVAYEVNVILRIQKYKISFLSSHLINIKLFENYLG